MVSNRISQGRVLTIIRATGSYLSIATLYVLTDAFYDWGLLKLDYPLGDILYFGRYALVVVWYSTKFLKHCLAHRIHRLRR